MLSSFRHLRGVLGACSVNAQKAGAWSGTALLLSHDDDRPDLEKIAPTLSEPRLHLLLHLPLSRLPPQLPEALTAFHHPRRGAWVAHPEQPSRPVHWSDTVLR